MTRHVSSKPGPRVTVSADRCDHDLLSCVKCGTAYPRPNTHYPHLWEPRYGRAHLEPLAGRRERRAAGRTATRFRGAKRRAVTDGHALGLPTSHGQTIRPAVPATEHALRHRVARDARRRERATRSTRAQRLSDFRRVTPGASRAEFDRFERDRRRMQRRAAAA